jgi:DNA-binding CsgD family transcriptional regulator
MFGRATELRELQHLLDGVRTGRGAALTLDGDPGIGKTALLDYARASAAGFRTVSALGVQAEQELPFSGLQQLLSALPDRTELLPPPQRRAILVALGITEGDAPGPLLVGLALLGLLTEASRDQPLLCAIDDVHWLDGSSVQALGFVARRLVGIPVALLFCKRRTIDVPALDSIPVLSIRGLAEEDSLRLLHSLANAPTDDAIAARIVEEGQGNPLLIRESVKASADLQAAAIPQLSDVSLPVESRLEENFVARIARLPEATALAVLLAAADPTGEPRVISRAAAQLGIGMGDLIPAESEGLIRMARRIAFEHPLIRSGVYRRASPEQRRRVHAALASSIDRERDPDRRAWHSALSTFAPSEDIAAELEASASRAGARGGFLAAAAFYERAAEFAETPETRLRCGLAAAEALELAGSLRRALAILDATREAAADPASRSRIDLMSGRLVLTMERSQRAVELFLAAGDHLADTDPAASRESHFEALSAATLAATGPDGSGIRDVAVRVGHTNGPVDQTEAATDLLLHAMLSLAVDPAEESLPRLRSQLMKFAAVDAPTRLRARWLWIACRLAAIGWDDERWGDFLDEGLAMARRAGALTALAATLTSEVPFAIFRGDGRRARAAADEAVGIWESISVPPAPYGIIVAAAWEGTPARDDLFAQALEDSAERGEGMVVPLVHWARALTAVADGRYSDGFTHAQAAARYPLTMLYPTWALVELVEAASRLGEKSAAQAAFARLRTSTRAADTHWARGVEARAEALLSDDPDDAEHLYRAAIEHLSRTEMRAESARSQLLYGEWLRRRRRRGEARVQLESALQTFRAMGARGFGERAVAEIAALGNGPAEAGALSTQEAKVARLASEGLSNSDIGARLHLSPSTVDYHLRKTFRKLGIASRSRLHLALSELDDATLRASGPTEETG